METKPETAGDLRGMVREVLREVLQSRSQPAGAVESVRIANDADLAAFVARITQPPLLETIRSGKLRFALQPAAMPAAGGAALDGVITEQKIDQLSAGGVLVLSPGAVLTPLARDKARRLGLKIERRS